MDAPRFFPELVFSTNVVVLDFETTGLSPARGDRAIEIGAVRILGGRLEERFSELMNPGFPVSSFITGFTGITNDMLAVAPPCGEVMTRFADFLGDSCLVAHNASFDLSFLSAELARVGRWHDPPVACTMKLARRLITDACNHRLGTLVAHCCIENDGTFHRALADADVGHPQAGARPGAGPLLLHPGIDDGEAGSGRRLPEAQAGGAPGAGRRARGIVLRYASGGAAGGNWAWSG